MEFLVKLLQILVALSIYNVWLIQYDEPSKWRGAHAKNIKEEFRAYGLPVWLCYVVGTSKVLLASLLIIALWFPVLLKPAALGLALLLLGSVAMHIKIKDPLYKSFPAFLFLVGCLFLAFHNTIFEA